VQLSREQLLSAYRRMRTIREFEERLNVEFMSGTVPGFLHLYSGQEAIAVGICEQLDDDRDYIGSTHRGHGHCIAKGVDVKGMMKEIYCKKNGVCGGKGGSMHIADLDKGMLGANAIVGGAPPLALGAALTAKTLKTGGVAVPFIGDGAANQGTVAESMNMASVLKLPMVFMFENNGYAEFTAASYATAGSIEARARAYNIPAVTVDGADFFAVHEAAREAIERARNGGGPSAIEAKAYRFWGHFQGDPQRYRAPNETKELRQNHDCLKNFRARVTEAALLDGADMDAIDAEVLALIEEAVVEAKADPQPDPASLYADVYVSYN
jgi:TPP-dependent pyruvate/acetoin dehydrogenase alpha subunit